MFKTISEFELAMNNQKQAAGDRTLIFPKVKNIVQS